MINQQERTEPSAIVSPCFLLTGQHHLLDKSQKNNLPGCCCCCCQTLSLLIFWDLKISCKLTDLLFFSPFFSFSSFQKTRELAAGSGRRRERHCDRRDGRVQVVQTAPKPDQQQVETKHTEFHMEASILSHLTRVLLHSKLLHQYTHFRYV